MSYISDFSVLIHHSSKLPFNQTIIWCPKWSGFREYSSLPFTLLMYSMCMLVDYSLKTTDQGFKLPIPTYWLKTYHDMLFVWLQWPNVTTYFTLQWPNVTIYFTLQWPNVTTYFKLQWSNVTTYFTLQWPNVTTYISVQ